MSQSLNLKVRGLYTHPNDLSEVPEGALARADNIVINKEGIAEPRRGLDRLEYPFASPANRANKLFTYQEKVLSHYATATLAYYDTLSGWVNYAGTFTPITGSSVRSAQASNNFYFTTASGVKVLDSFDGTPSSAGMPQGLDGTLSLTGVSGFMTNDTQVGYRVLWGIKDANNNLILGAPSQRLVISNSAGGTRDVSLTLTIPAGISVNHFIQVYRSPLSADANTEPSEEFGLVYEANPTSGEITAKALTFTDSTPDALRGATLYTSPSQQGIAQSNNEPPLAKDIAEFKGCLWYLNTKSKHRFNLTLISAGGTIGVQANDTLTIAGTTYTAKATEDASLGHFKVFTAGTPAQNIADTAYSLVRVINKYATNTLVYAYYLSSEGDLPGKILIESRALGGASFAVTASNGDAFNPVLPSSGTSQASTNDEFKNGLMNSKLQEPEAVPIANVRRLGSAAAEGLRIIPTRDALFVLKQDGIWRVTGDYPNFNVDPLDLSAKLLAPESAVVLNNQIYCLTDQGVVTVSDTGIQVVSRPIEISILELFGANLDNVKELSFGISYETERKYILFLPTSSADTYCTQALVFNTFTNTWTRWVLSKTCGIVEPGTDLLYLGDAISSNVNVERKSYSFRDYVDDEMAATIVSSGGKSVVLTSVTGFNVGDLLYQSASLNSQILSIDTATQTVETAEERAWTAGAATVYAAIECIVEWVPQTGGNPGLLKQFQEVALLFRNNYFPRGRIGFYSELSGGLEDTEVAGTYGGLWGLFPWGETSWGGVQRPRVIRTYVPREKAWCSQLSLRFTFRMGFALFQLQGASVFFEKISERLSK